MTPAQIEEYCRRVTNTKDDDFFASAEIIENYLYSACLQVSEQVPCLETYQTAVSVASQQTYSIPDDAMQIKRVVYDGNKLQKITMRQLDTLEGNETLDQATGRPEYYWIWGDYLYLYPVPNASSDTIEIYSIDRHSAIAATDTSISIPKEWHTRLCNFIIAQIHYKQGDSRAVEYIRTWEGKDLPFMMLSWRKRKRKDGFYRVQTRKALPETDWGIA